MNRQKPSPASDRVRASRRRRSVAPRLEGLEDRALLTSTTFAAPNIGDLLAAARAGRNAAPATINRELGALRSQLTSGPLGDLNSGTATQATFLTEANALVASFNQQVDAALLPRYPSVDAIIRLGGAKVLADLSALNTQVTVGTVASSAFAAQAGSSIAGLNTGPLRAQGTTNQALGNRTRAFSSSLNVLAQSLGMTSTSSLTIAQVSTLTTAQGNAYLADMNASLYGRPNVTAALRSAVTTLQTQVSAIVGGTGTGATQARYQAAVTTFNNSMLKLARAIGG